MTRLLADRLAGALTLLLLAALTVAAWLLKELGLPGAAVVVQRAPETLKASLQEVRIERADLLGQRLYAMEAKAGALSEGGQISLVQPTLERTLKGQQQTRMQAGAAMLSADQSDVLLSEGVRTTQTRLSGQPDTTALTTAELLIQPRQERASTQGDVRIEQQQRTLTGRGLELDLRTGRYRVLADPRLEIRP